MQTIYVDVLIILNIYVNFLLLKTTAKITHSRLKAGRCFIASAYGSIYALLILIPNLNGLLNLTIKLFAAATIVIIAFGINNKIRFFINIFSFIIVNFIFAGVIYAVYIWLKPSFIHFNNTYFYVDFSLVILIAVTAILYIVLCISRYIGDRYSTEARSYKIYIKYKGKTTAISGFPDTGNSLVDFFSGRPVIICSSKSLANIVTLDYDLFEDSLPPKGFRLIPYSTIGNSGMLPIFSPDEVLILNEDTGERRQVDAMVGIKSNESSAIFNPRLLKL